MKLITQIDDTRTFTFSDRHEVHLCWDGITATLEYSAFTQFVAVLKAFRGAEYASEGSFTAVRVDGESSEIWLDNICLALNEPDLRALTNAVLSTQTRLLGILRHTPRRDPLANIDIRPVGIWGPPRATRYSLN